MTYLPYTGSSVAGIEDASPLERSPSLMSRSSGASTPPPVTPCLSSTGSFNGSGSSSNGSHNWNGASSLSRSGAGGIGISGGGGGGHAGVHPEKSILAYQSKYLSRTGSVQSISNIAALPRTSTLQALSKQSSGNEEANTSIRNKRTTWAPGHRMAGSASISSVDDIMGRFGGRTTPTQTTRPSSPASAAGPATWRNSLQSRTNSSPSTRTENSAVTPSASMYRSKSSYAIDRKDDLENRPLSPTSSVHNAPVESEIMKHTLSGRPKSKTASVDLGSVSDLTHSSVSYLRNFREFAVSGSSQMPDNGLERTFTVKGGGAGAARHRRTQTLPSLGIEPLRAPSPEKQTGIPRSRTRLGMHGLDRVSERSDGSIGNDEGPTDRLGFGFPEGAMSSRGRRMASDAGQDETGAIVIPGITVGQDSVAGMTGRLRLARQPTRTKYGNLPSQTMKAMDNQRQNLQAYEYLCHVSEAKEWLVQCLTAHPMSPTMVSASPDLTSPTFSPQAHAEDDEDPSGLSNKSIVELEDALRNGVALARLARAFMGPRAVPRIFTVSCSQTLCTIFFLKN